VNGRTGISLVVVQGGLKRKGCGDRRWDRVFCEEVAFQRKGVFCSRFWLGAGCVGRELG
jgi:hypothetical protein